MPGKAVAQPTRSCSASPAAAARRSDTTEMSASEVVNPRSSESVENSGLFIGDLQRLERGDASPGRG